jgi:hypothetical protein
MTAQRNVMRGHGRVVRFAQMRFATNYRTVSDTNRQCTDEAPHFALQRTGERSPPTIRSAHGYEDVFGDLWRRVEVFSEVKPSYQTARAGEYVGGAFVPTGRIADLCTVAKDVNRDASSVNVGDSQ